jgi:hypothetical protein
MSDEINNVIPEEFPTDEDDIIEEEVEEEDDDFDFEDDDYAPVVDPTQVITLRTSGGETRYVPSDEPLSLSQVKALSGLTFGAVTFYMNAAVIGDDTVIPVGSTVSVIGNVKGGR